MSDYSIALEELVNSGIVPKSEPVKESVSTDKLIIDEMSRITGIQFSDEQRQCLEHRGSCVIMACAGSGKTSVLTNMLAKRIWNREILDTNRVICTTYSKSGADEMNVRLDKLFERLNIRCKLEVRTLHSFFYSLLRTFGIVGQKIISSGVRLQYIKEACKDAGYICKDDDLIVIDNLISYRVNNLLNDSKALSSPACSISDMTVNQFSEIRRGYDFRKTQNNYIDFDDMQLYIYKWLCVDTKSEDENTRNTGIAIRNYCKGMYDEFYIDEAQDISKIQYEIVKAIVTDSNTGLLDKTLVFMGDDDQCIYKWRGASPEIILTVDTELRMKSFVLSTNYRCCSEVVNFAHRSIVYNNARFNKGMSSYKSGGSVEIYQSNSMDLYELSKVAFEQIKKLIDNGTKKSDIAVLCRNNVHLSVLNVMLVNEGIYSNILDEMKLTNTYIYKDIKDIMTVAKNTYSGKVTSRVMWKLCELMTTHISKQLGTFQEDNGLSTYDTLTYVLSRILKVHDVEVGSNISVNSKSEQKLTYALARVKNETIKSMKNIVDIMQTENIENRTSELITTYLINTDFIYKNTDKRRNMQGIVHFIQDEINNKGFDKTLGWLQTVEQMENSNFKPPMDAIRMSTIHGAKGREWKNVILFACDNEAIPGTSSIGKMLDNKMPISDVIDVIDEERRLYYVACTRAKESLKIITSLHASTFLCESLGDYRDMNGSNNETVIAMALYGDKVRTIDNGAVSNKEIEERIQHSNESE